MRDNIRIEGVYMLVWVYALVAVVVGCLVQREQYKRVPYEVNGAENLWGAGAECIPKGNKRGEVGKTIGVRVPQKGAHVRVWERVWA